MLSLCWDQPYNLCGFQSHGGENLAINGFSDFGHMGSWRQKNGTQAPLGHWGIVSSIMLIK